MPVFNIVTAVKKNLEDFESTRLVLAKKGKQETLRVLKSQSSAYTFNQGETIATIDMFYSDQFEQGLYDNGQRKIFLNVSKLRSEVSSKQIDIDVKDIRFVPEQYANPWTSFFMQRDFKEWSKKEYFGELINKLVEAFPKYGSVVVKPSEDGDVDFVPLQNLKCEQTAENLNDASYVIEEHPGMTLWEAQEYKEWNLEGFNKKKFCLYEQYAHVPKSWLASKTLENFSYADNEEFVDALVVITFDRDEKKDNKGHLFFAGEIKQRPYEEAHWSRRHGRWLGVGVMEDLFENQRAQNIITNLRRRQLHWASKKVFQSTVTDLAAKNLIQDVKDGDIIAVGQGGTLNQVDLASRSGAEFDAFVQEWQRNGDQKAFTYEVATGEALPSGTPFRLGILLSNSTNSFFSLKREKLALFIKRFVNEFLIDRFIKDMTKKDRIVQLFSDEQGFESLKVAAMEWVKSEAVRASLLSGEMVDTSTIEEAIQPFDAVKSMLYSIPKDLYTEARMKFDIDITGESMDVPKEIESLTNLYQVLLQTGQVDRAMKVIDRASALAGVDTAAFQAKAKAMPTPQLNAPQPQPAPQAA